MIDNKEYDVKKAIKLINKVSLESGEESNDSLTLEMSAIFRKRARKTTVNRQAKYKKRKDQEQSFSNPIKNGEEEEIKTIPTE